MTAVRTAVKAYLVTQLQEALPLVATSHGWPGDKLDRDHIWVDRVVGTVTFPFIQAGTKTRDDEFTVKVIFQASQPGDSIAECDERVEGYLQVFEELIAEDPSLGGMAELIHSKFDESSVEGPMGEFTDQGAVSFASAELSVHSRIP